MVMDSSNNDMVNSSEVVMAVTPPRQPVHRVSAATTLPSSQITLRPCKEGVAMVLLISPKEVSMPTALRVRLPIKAKVGTGHPRVTMTLPE